MATCFAGAALPTRPITTSLLPFAQLNLQLQTALDNRACPHIATPHSRDFQREGFLFLVSGAILIYAFVLRF